MHLLASNADTFHSSCCKRGPLVEDSEMAFVADDFFNVHNRVYPVLGTGSTTSMCPFFVRIPIDVPGFRPDP